jgi:hypothetical protein
MYIGLVIFFFLAVLCIVAFAKVRQRNRRYGRGR